ncbi:mechanosensitive ion channel family protein [Nonomuraea muscovyensis]|uniref:Small conductance mechanosensitive channel n=1 Tax=Nonomuraea muscovyensis TaxID=1124761 RepID=A0A7X0C759_9ACTN|nr:mechanosensitive ion channel family protein [Nonomuraea muscovyensis]MBB6349783.1 small conductance mechanosensitive channel [Nonomuraea muscovyensis]MDF2705275.1 mechanosensitive ion channel protein MscS [Nonomuraea muscovyensis]
MSTLAAPAPSPSPTPTSTESVLPSLDKVGSDIANACADDGFICATVAGFFDGALWAPLVASAITIALILLLGFVIRNIAHRLITRVVGRAAVGGAITTRFRRGSAPEGIDALLHERRKQRAETMGSVLKHIASIVILGTTILTVLDRLTIPIAPVLTSVGILGVAIGFGAQELVKDFIAGMFMLLEDQYGVGDVIDAGAAVGTVEAVTLRITRLRDADGRVWYVRNGTITRVGNESQGWSRSYVDVPVGYASDVTAVRDVLERVAKEVWDDPEFRETSIVERPTVFGVEQLSDSSLVFRVSAKTLPTKQADVSRELRLRVKAALDAAGIAMVPTA